MRCIERGWLGITHAVLPAFTAFACGHLIQANEANQANQADRLWVWGGDTRAGLPAAASWRSVSRARRAR